MKGECGEEGFRKKKEGKESRLSRGKVCRGGAQHWRKAVMAKKHGEKIEEKKGFFLRPKIKAQAVKGDEPRPQRGGKNLLKENQKKKGHGQKSN